MRLGNEAEHEQSKLVHFMSKFGRIGALFRKWTSASDLERHANDLFNIGGSTVDLLRAIHEKNQVRDNFLKKWSE